MYHEQHCAANMGGACTCDAGPTEEEAEAMRTVGPVLLLWFLIVIAIVVGIET